MLEKELIIFAVVFFIVKYLWQNRRLFYLASKIPRSEVDISPRGIWKAIIADNVGIFEMVAVGNHGPMKKTWVGPHFFVIACSPEDIKIVLNAKECLDKPPFLLKFANLKEGTLFGQLPQWQSHRKIISPFFGVQSLRNTVIPIFNTTTDVLMKNFATMDGEGDFNVFHYMTALTLETILKVMEYDVDIQNQRGEKRDTFIHNLEM